jgi:UDP-N-acetylmuramoyl-L-alanyl-D-glutamate--2,6-diaminopimelate ligase
MTGFVRQTLSGLVRIALPGAVYEGPMPETRVTGVTYDSRQLQAGFIFVAVQGQSVDGHHYIPQVIERGASAVVGTQPLSGLAVPYIRVEDTRMALSALSAAFYDYPANQMTMIGITGTDGKTTTANLVYHILLAAGLPAGMISTVNAVIGKEVLDTGFHVTTPEAPDVQRYLARMRSAGLTHVVLESTSHGLEQHRVSGCSFDISVITNITHEHLDYHGSYEAYRAAKARLFSLLAETPMKTAGNPQLAVLNRDDSSFEYLSSVAPGRKVSYGLDARSDLRAESIRYESDGLHFNAIGPNFQQDIHTCLLGSYNVANCLAALATTVLGLGIDPQTAQRGIANLPGVPGRMERISMGQDFLAVVDFAHTPNALRQALLAAREMTAGKVIVVFGSAGLRDREKRFMMAETAAGLADWSIITAEDPRTESLDGILAEMARGAETGGGVESKSFLRVADRGDALRRAVALAQPGDLVMACGKGHEQSMCFGAIEYDWDDRTAMRAALAEHLHVPGPVMPYLPTKEQG